MKVRLTERDIELIIFLGKYKKIKGTDCKKIYRSKDYYRKRLKVLEKERYIKRDKRIIKLDEEGKILAEMIGYGNRNMCRNKNYQERMDDIIKIATLSLGSNIEFTPSWQMKEDAYTNYGKKYIGKLKLDGNDYIAYYISKRNSLIYTKQIFTDININILADRVILFIEDFKMLSRINRYFVTGKQETKIINPTEKNLELMQILETIDLYEILMDVYIGEELLISNWEKADYRIEEEKYIICMPFIDVEKLHSLNCRSNIEYDKKVEIVTLKENERKIKEIVKGKINIIFLDEWIERYKKLYNEMLEQIKNLK